MDRRLSALESWFADRSPEKIAALHQAAEDWALYRGGEDPAHRDRARQEARTGRAPTNWRAFVEALRDYGTA